MSERQRVYPQDSGDDEVFFVRQKFSGVEELKTAKKIYEGSHFCELWKRDILHLDVLALQTHF